MATDSASFALALIDRVTAPTRAISKSLDAVNKQFKSLAKQDTVTSGLRDALSSVNSKLFSFGKTAALALGAAGIAVGGFVVKGVVHMGMFAESIKMAFGLLTGDKAIGDATFTRTIELSKQLGLGVEETAHSMQKLLAMQFSPPDAEKWVRLGSDLRAVGVQGDAVQRVMLDIAHVKATGKLNQRNVNMFANAGVSAQLLMEEVGKAMGTNEAGAMAAMHKGKITSAIALPALERAIMRKTHEHAAGEAGTGFAQKTLTGLTGQLQNAPALLFLKISEAAQDSLERLKPLVQSVMNAIDQVNVSQVARFVGNVLDMLTSLVPLAVEFANGFGEGLSEISDVIGGGKVAAESLQTARDLGHALASAFAEVLRIIGKIVDAFVWLNEHRWAAWSLAGLYIALNIFSQMGNIAKGIELSMVAAKGIGALLGIGGSAAAAAAPAVTGALAGGARELVLGGEGAALELAAAGEVTAAGGGVAAAGGGAAAAGGAAAWGSTAVGAASVGALALAALPGLMIGGAGYYFREEIAKGMLGMLGPRADEATGRGLGAGAATPTAMFTGLEAAGSKQPNNVTVGNINLQIDGTGKDGAQIGRDAAEAAGTHIQQNWQSLAFESGG
jgi:hypothetical protein